MDLLGFGPDDADTLQTVFGEICAIDTDQGVRFDAGTIAVAANLYRSRTWRAVINDPGALGVTRAPWILHAGYKA